MPSTATNTDIANAIKNLNLSVLGNVTYEYHYCNGSCYNVCNGIMQYVGEGDTAGGYQTWFMCDKCGRNFTSGPGWNGQTWTCGAQTKICGHNNGDIIKAVITY